MANQAPSQLPARLQPWWDFATKSGAAHGVDPLLGLAVLDCESQGGLTLRPPEPGGTGDFVPRKWARYEGKPGMGERVKRFFNDNGEEFCLPIDGHGWGRGLMQLDWMDPPNFEFLATVLLGGLLAWKDPAENIDFGFSRLAAHIRTFDGEEAWAVARYNASPDRVQKARLSISEPSAPEKRIRAADSVTHTKHYVTDVLARRDRWRRLMSVEIPTA